MFSILDFSSSRAAASPSFLALTPLAAATAVFIALAGAAPCAQAQSAESMQSPQSVQFAQSVPAAPAAGTAAARSTVVVTGRPLGGEDVAAPVSVLSGDRLLLQRGSSLGETLSGVPGVSSSWFGPNANRPAIRGQDGDRIRLLTNAGSTLDASSLSFDHAVPIDPLVVERLEVVRGPAALLYGGSAVGGVVNAIDNRIPRHPVEGWGGAVEARFGGAARERGASALVEAGGAGFALHADAFKRRTEDLRVPRFDRAHDGSTASSERVVNSASDAEGGALGGSMILAAGHLGASVDTYRNFYGVVAEDDIRIRMRRDRLALDGEWRDLGGFVKTVRAQGSRTDYRHEEIEGSGEVGTTFSNEGSDLRLEALHRPLAWLGGTLEGVWGVQAESSRFEALGDEAFVPSTRTRQTALFALQQWRQAETLQLSAGVRAERVRVASAGDAVDAPEPRFGAPARRSFSPRSASMGASWRPATAWTVSGSLSYTERAPTSYELYANGLHAATSTFERGDPDQRLERGRHLEVGVAWQHERDMVKANVFASRFARYITLTATGEPDFEDDEGGLHPVYAFDGVRARLHGVEIEGRKQLFAGLELGAQVSVVRGDDLTNGQPLPRIAPLRAQVSLGWDHGPWRLGGEVEHAARQRRVPADDTATRAWTVVNAALSYRQAIAGAEALWFLKLQNLGDTLAYNASTISTVRALSPLPGRAVQAGVRVRF